MDRGQPDVCTQGCEISIDPLYRRTANSYLTNPALSYLQGAKTSIMNLRLTVSQMMNTHGKLFKIARPGGELLLGRVVTKGYVGGATSTGGFRLYDDFQQFEDVVGEPDRKEITIHDGGFIVVQVVDRYNFDQPSTYERILALDREIQSFKESYRDYGIIVRNLPDKLEELKGALATYEEEQQTINTGMVEDLLEAHISECRKCPPSFGKTLEEDQAYKVMTIRQAKYYAREAVRIALSIYVPAKITALPSVWQPSSAGQAKFLLI
jgi:hypothetical protein